MVAHHERHTEPFGEVERAQAVGAEVRVDDGDTARPTRPFQPAEQVAGHMLEDRVPVGAAPDADDDVGFGQREPAHDTRLADEERRVAPERQRVACG